MEFKTQVYFVGLSGYDKTQKAVAGNSVAKIKTGERGHILEVIEYNTEKNKARTLTYFPKEDDLASIDTDNLSFMDLIELTLSIESMGDAPRFVKVDRKVKDSPFALKNNHKGGEK